MASTKKKNAVRSNKSDIRRSAKREFDQRHEGIRAEDEARTKRTQSNTLKKRKKYATDVQIVDKLDTDFRGEISYRLLGNKRLRVDSARELTRESSFLGMTTKKVLNLGTGKESSFYLSLHEAKTWRSVSRLQFAENGTLLAKHVKHRDGRFEEKWERDDAGSLIRTRYVDHRRLGGGLFQPVSEEMTGPYQKGSDGKAYRKLIRRKGSRRETFERDDKGKLTLIDSKSPGFVSSKQSTKAANLATSETKIQRLGGAFSKSYRSLLDKEGNELGRDISAHRRLLNKRSAVYDDVSGQLKSTKHTFGKIYKSETSYQHAVVKKVSKKILGVTVLRKRMLLSERELDAQRLRAEESAMHKQVWQERLVTPESSLREHVNIPSARTNGGDSTRSPSPLQQPSLTIPVLSQSPKPTESALRSAAFQPMTDLESLFGKPDDQLPLISPSSKNQLSSPDRELSRSLGSALVSETIPERSANEGGNGRDHEGGLEHLSMPKQRSLESAVSEVPSKSPAHTSVEGTSTTGNKRLDTSSEEFVPLRSIQKEGAQPTKPIRRAGIVSRPIPISLAAREQNEPTLASIAHSSVVDGSYSPRPNDRDRSGSRSASR
ncbi:virA/G regulated protein [Rhizobium rhizogenes]|uniref:virA/G regulated protein n=1 Tax=Rhizobium rhizogenes TaxID=359 RepID=UPI0022B66119|nr:virA/G regulated protein [Rhizobium rhizogenes]MCZ7448297.1 virA/G regulated protein [Rhizobium rhizogenes]MCZ7465728.1 virA/G regulated protein [Rhizobium rhizogenes]